MKKLLIGAALAVSMLAAAPAANAATVIALPAPQANGTIAADFNQNGITAGGFEHTFKFELPAAGVSSIGLITIAADAFTDVEFAKVTLNDTVEFEIHNGVFSIASLEKFPTLSGWQTLFVKGTSGSNGSYGINLSFSPSAAVPEPATWAMMIIGFTGAGVAIRRRRSDATPALA